MKIQLLLLFFFYNLSYSQNWQWIKEGGGTGTADTYTQEQVYSMVTDSQNNIYILSRVSGGDVEIDSNPKATFGYGDPKDVVLASFSCDGTYRWSKIIGGNGIESIDAVQVDSQDNVYITGKVATCDGGGAGNFYYARIDNEYQFTNTGSACTLIFLAKFDSNGNLQYVKRPQLPTTSSLAGTYTRSYNFEIQNDLLYWFVWLPPGVYAEGAFTNNTTATHAPYVLKYNLDGSFIEAVQLGTIQGLYDVNLKYYRNLNNGYYYMTLFKVNSGGTFSINGQPIVNSAALICYDNIGNLLWKKENNNNNANYMKFFGLDFDPQNNIYIAGSMVGMNMNSFLGYAVSIANTPAFVMKLDSTADNLLWASNYDSVGSNGYGDLIYNGNEIAYTGWCAGTNFTWGSQSIYVTAANEGQDVLFARFDSTTGNCLSLHKINSNVGTTDYGNAIAVDASGDYIVGGGFGQNIYDMNNTVATNEGGPTDFFLARFSAQACSTLNTESFEETFIRLYPNPSKGMVTLDYQLETAAQLQVIDVSGRVVLERELVAAETSVQFATTVMASGVYAVQVLGNSGGVWRSKLIIE